MRVAVDLLSRNCKPLKFLVVEKVQMDKALQWNMDPCFIHPIYYLLSGLHKKSYSVFFLLYVNKICILRLICKSATKWNACRDKSTSWDNYTCNDSTNLLLSFSNNGVREQWSVALAWINGRKVSRLQNTRWIIATSGEYGFNAFGLILTSMRTEAFELFSTSKSAFVSLHEKQRSSWHSLNAFSPFS